MRLASILLTVTFLLSSVLVSSPRTLGQNAGAAAKSNPKLGFDPANFDPNCKPCEDFNRFVNGGWMARTQIPASQSRWGSFHELIERNQTQLRNILEEAAARPDADKGKLKQQLGDFYAAAMDEAKIESLGATPLQGDFDRISKIKDVTGLQIELARLHSFGVRAAFGFGALPDLKNSTQVIGSASQGGLGLPDRDYYLKDDPKSAKIREEYVKYATKIFELLGDNAEKAAANAKTVFELEKKLAENSMTRVERRDPNASYHKMTRAEIKALTPNFAWDAYFKELGVPNIGDVNIGQPKFFQALDGYWTSVPLDEWKTYLKWRIADGAAPYLSSKFVDANFAFQGTVLTGTTENRPRWKRMTDLTDRLLGDPLGQLYVRKHFSPEAKAKVSEILNNIKAALRENLQTLDWMGDDTRKQAIAKLDAIVNKIGYPDKWKDFSSIKINRQTFLENIRNCTLFDSKDDLAKIGKPVDRAEWAITPATVNAYYNPLFNEIVFPAGILHPPFYSPEADDAVNYGGIGAVIGHEIGHGFDDSGSQFDKDGNLKNWWSPEDRKKFQDRAGCVEQQFSGYQVEGANVNGKLVLGESLADLGGLTLAHLAYQKSLGGKPGREIDGYTSDQRFFIGFGQVWRTLARPEFLRLQVATDPHPPAQFRANGTVANMDAFAKAFGCKAGDAMVRESRCRLW